MADYGRRLAGKLTADLVLESPQGLNPVGDYELDLRRNKLAVIENLGATRDQFESIDLSENEIMRLDGFPKLHKLEQLLLHRNRIYRIERRIGESVPNLARLILTGNKISNLQDLDPLEVLHKLEMLSLLDNPVTKKPHYRLYAIYKIPSLRVLDFQKVRDAEREEAKELFGTRKGTEAIRAAETTLEEQEPVAEVERPTPEQLAALRLAIANAKSLDEVSRLEEALQRGQIPEEIKQAATAQPMEEG
eukprot:CAMPEP_0183829092 /NCGR_PEP_ID=MMETSP0807_2-20130328/3129_1 /TAXON_ID=88271 /ORGANISM="Picocystis salinarum, Strain CCMP1897" /LENGTH=247 /DNA_ID=CAMNT_0026074299 /DNA_START=54 /DNA_END=797 /DNA_ORIENTATION=-